MLQEAFGWRRVAVLKAFLRLGGAQAGGAGQGGSGAVGADSGPWGCFRSKPLMRFHWSIVSGALP